MKKEDVSQIINQIDEKNVKEATMFALENSRQSMPPERREKAPRRFRGKALAACLALIVIIGSTAAAAAAESKEYNNAVAFFEENGLSAEGLSRSEVKAVYRDITQKKFSYGKTADVIQQAVPGREISQHEPTPEEIAALWDGILFKNSVSGKGISFRIDTQYVTDEKRGFDVLEKSMLHCCQNGEILWTVEFRDFYISDYAHTKEGTVIWGSGEWFSSADPQYSWIALVDENGSIKWQKRLDHGFHNEFVASILANGDGTWAVISRGDLKFVCLSCYDSAGNERSFHKTEVGNYGIRNAARLGDGYIIQLWNQIHGETALLCKMDRDGTLTDSFSYEEDNTDYYITDMTEFAGQIYLSAYAVPKQRDEGGRHEIANILDYICSKEGGWNISSEELTPLIRDNYTAMLLICNPEGGDPRAFYSVKGSLGGDLAVNTEGQLEWNVESITTTLFSPYTNAYSIGGSCNVFCYTFDTEGSLIRQTDTGETTPYWR